MTKPTVKLTVKEKTQVSPVTDAHLKNEPTLSQDCLEAVPAWGEALIEHVEKQGELMEDIIKYQGKLEARVAALEPVVGNLFDRVAALEALCPQGDLD